MVILPPVTPQRGRDLGKRQDRRQEFNPQ